MAGQALDKVRKDLVRQGSDLRGGLWALRGKAWTRDGKRAQPEGWLAWAERSRLTAFRNLVRTLKNHRDGVLAYMETKLTNGLMEAIKGLLQLAKRTARGFRNFHYFRLAAYLKASGLNFQTPWLLPT